MLMLPHSVKTMHQRASKTAFSTHS